MVLHGYMHYLTLTSTEAKLACNHKFSLGCNDNCNKKFCTRYWPRKYMDEFNYSYSFSSIESVAKGKITSASVHGHPFVRFQSPQ